MTHPVYILYIVREPGDNISSDKLGKGLHFATIVTGIDKLHSIVAWGISEHQKDQNRHYKDAMIDRVNCFRAKL